MFSDFDDVLSFAWKNLIFCGISTVVFLVKKGGVFLLSVSGIARFFPAVQLYVGLGILYKLFEVCKLYGLGLIFV